MGLAAPAGRGRPGRQRLHAGCATSSRRVGWGVRGHVAQWRPQTRGLLGCGGIELRPFPTHTCFRRLRRPRRRGASPPPLTSAAQSSPNHAARTTCRPIVGGAREDRDELRHSRAVNHRRAAGVEEEPEVVRVVVAATTPGPGDSGCRPQLRPGGCARFLHARMRYPARLSRRAHDEATRRGGRLRLHTLSWKEFVLFMIMGGIIAATPHTAVDLRRHRGIVVWSSGNGGCLFL